MGPCPPRRRVSFICVGASREREKRPPNCERPGASKGWGRFCPEKGARGCGGIHGPWKQRNKFQGCLVGGAGDFLCLLSALIFQLPGWNPSLAAVGVEVFGRRGSFFGEYLSEETLGCCRGFEGKCSLIDSTTFKYPPFNKNKSHDGTGETVSSPSAGGRWEVNFKGAEPGIRRQPEWERRSWSTLKINK